MTHREAARVFGVSASTIERRAREHSIRSRWSTDRRNKRWQLHDGDWLREKFDSGRRIADIADELGVAYGTVVNARNQFGIGTPRAPKRQIDVDEVRQRLEAGESLRAIARALGHSSSAISTVVRRHGLE